MELLKKIKLLFNKSLEHFFDEDKCMESIEYDKCDERE